MQDRRGTAKNDADTGVEAVAMMMAPHPTAPPYLRSSPAYDPPQAKTAALR